MPYIVGFALIGAALPLGVALASRDEALRDIGKTVLKFVVVMPAVGAAIAVGLFHALA